MKKSKTTKKVTDKKKKTKVLQKTIPLIKVISITDNDDGTCIMKYEASDEFVALVSKKKKIESPTEKDIGDFLINILEKAANKEDGYGFKKTKGKK